MADDNNKNPLFIALLILAVVLLAALCFGRGISYAFLDAEQFNNLTITVTDQPNGFPVVIDYLNPEFGGEMAVDAGFNGTPILIYDGNDTPGWNPLIISGNWNLEDTAQAHTGTRSLGATNVVDGDVVQFKNGANIEDYPAVTGWIYIQEWFAQFENEVHFYAYDTVGGSTDGFQINLSDYIEINEFDVWQKFVIPIDDFNASASGDAFRIEAHSNNPSQARAPEFYIDDLQMENSSNVLRYQVIPIPGTTYYVTDIKAIFHGPMDTDRSDATVPSINVSKLFNIDPITNGILGTQTVSGQSFETTNVKSVKDFMDVPETNVVDFFNDGDKTYMTIRIEFVSPLILNADTSDTLNIDIRDDLSELGSLAITTGGYFRFNE